MLLLVRRTDLVLLPPPMMVPQMDWLQPMVLARSRLLQVETTEKGPAAMQLEQHA